MLRRGPLRLCGAKPKPMETLRGTWYFETRPFAALRHEAKSMENQWQYLCWACSGGPGSPPKTPKTVLDCVDDVLELYLVSCWYEPTRNQHSSNTLSTQSNTVLGISGGPQPPPVTRQHKETLRKTWYFETRPFATSSREAKTYENH